MKEYEIIGKDVYGTQAVTKNNTTNCSNCRYKGEMCFGILCKDFFYLKDEELEKINNEKIQQLESRIKELEATIENMKSIAINLQQPEQVRTTTSVDLIDDSTTELIVETENFFGDEITINKTACCSIVLFGYENYCPNCGRKIKK